MYHTSISMPNLELCGVFFFFLIKSFKSLEHDLVHCSLSSVYETVGQHTYRHDPVHTDTLQAKVCLEICHPLW